MRESDMDSNPFVFIVGCPRSGTTLLQRLVDAHSQVAVTPETHWIPAFFQERTGLTPDGLVTPGLITRLLAYRTFPKLGISQDQLERLLHADAPVSYPRFVSEVFTLYGAARGRELVGDKTPGYARHVPLLHELFPGARFVHLIRDGRDVCLSATGWQRKLPRLIELFPTWHEDPVSTAALWWKWHVDSARAAGRALPPALYRELRYERLVADPATECAELCDFLGIAYDAAMLRFHEGRTAAKAGVDAKHGWLPVTPGLRDWRIQMPPADIEGFEAVAGDLLEELGYSRACLEPAPAARGRAARMQALFLKRTCVEKSR
jgi:hypothetical protein